jgi:hypothetical protein
MRTQAISTSKDQSAKQASPCIQRPHVSQPIEIGIRVGAGSNGARETAVAEEAGRGYRDGDDAMSEDQANEGKRCEELVVGNDPDAEAGIAHDSGGRLSRRRGEAKTEARETREESDGQVRNPRKRGRPRKPADPAMAAALEKKANEPKRERGRPRKHVQPAAMSASENEESAAEERSEGIGDEPGGEAAKDAEQSSEEECERRVYYLRQRKPVHSIPVPEGDAGDDDDVSEPEPEGKPSDALGVGHGDVDCASEGSVEVDGVVLVRFTSPESDAPKRDISKGKRKKQGRRGPVETEAAGMGVDKQAVREPSETPFTSAAASRPAGNDVEQAVDDDDWDAGVADIITKSQGMLVAFRAPISSGYL